MTIKELIERRAALLAELAKPETTAERFAEIRPKSKNSTTLSNAQRKTPTTQNAKKNSARLVSLTAAHPPPQTALYSNRATPRKKKRRAAEKEEIEKRANALKAGNKATFELRAVSTTKVAMTDLASGEINPAFEQVGTLDKLVKIVPLQGAERKVTKPRSLKRSAKAA